MSAKATRQVFGETIAKLGEKNPNIVVLDADLSKSTKMYLLDFFLKEYVHLLDVTFHEEADDLP